MSKAFLRAKAEIIYEEVPYVLERQCSDGIWVLRHKHTERPLERTTAQLFDAYASGALTFREHDLHTISSSNKRKNRVPRKELTVKAKAADIQAGKLRLAYVRAVVGLPYTQSVIKKAINEVWALLKPAPGKKPSWISVYRWARAYLDSNQSPNALVATYSDRGNRSARFPQELLDICGDVIENIYLTLERPCLQHTLELTKAETRAANKLLPKAGQLVMPSRGLMRRLIAEIPAYDRHAARYGRESARKRFRSVQHHRLTSAPLQRGEMDHTRMNLLVIDDVHGVPLGRPWLTLLVDDFTRCILGFCLSFEPPSRATVARCLRHAFVPKTGLRAEYPDLKNDWMAFGVVSEVVLDGGAEFRSQELEQICFELDVEQHFAPRKTPWFKGKVERVQGTLNRGVTITAPGKTFDGILEREDYDPMKHAVVTMSGLRHVIIRWIVDVYHQKKHSALGCSPAQMWANSVRIEDIPLMNDPLRFDAITGGAANRVLTHKGIEYAGLLYNSPEMTDLRRHLGDRTDVDIRFDRSNIGSVIVLHPERGTPYRLPCLRPDYAEGLTEWQHEVCKKYARWKNASRNDVDDWLDSLLEISGIVEQELKLSRKKGVTRERVARWSEGKMPVAEPVAPATTELPHQKDLRLPQPVAPKPPPSAPIQTPKSPELDVSPVVRRHFKPIIENRQQINSFDGDGRKGVRSHE